ncbi:hypothetical protein K9M16_02585 [Candidatus Babeliales bacterium]|nr:hypothetical protein [Candidatus Babeliales bacterium]
MAFQGKNFTKQNRLFFLKKIIFCLFFAFSYQNSFAMQESVDITKYTNANIADPKIEAQFLQDILAIKNDCDSSVEQSLMQNLHDRLQSVLNKKKEERELNDGELKETLNSIKIAIKRNIINPAINGIYERILNLKKEDFEVFANIGIPENPKQKKQNSRGTWSFFGSNFKNNLNTLCIVENFKEQHKFFLNKLDTIYGLDFEYSRNMYRRMFNDSKKKLEIELDIILNSNISSSKKLEIEAEAKTIFDELQQKYNFFEKKLSEKKEARTTEENNRKWKDFINQKETKYQQKQEYEKYYLKNDSVIQKLLAQFENENAIFLSKIESSDSIFNSLNFEKTKTNYTKMHLEIENKIKNRVDEIIGTKNFNIKQKIFCEQKNILTDICEKYSSSINLSQNKQDLRIGKQISLSVIIILNAVCLAYYSHNKNKECKQDLEIILNKLKNKLKQEKIDQLVKKRSTFFQKYLPIWMKKIFGMQCDWKKYLNKISKLSQKELENLII